jgi:hypothetical protein
MKYHLVCLVRAARLHYSSCGMLMYSMDVEIIISSVALIKVPPFVSSVNQ